MRQIKYIIIDNSGQKGRESHYCINSKGAVSEETDIRKAVKVIDRKVDPDGYNANSVVVSIGFRFHDSGSMKCGTWILEQRSALIDLLVELRSHFPEAKILGIREIGDYFIKVSDEMNALRLELSNI